MFRVGLQAKALDLMSLYVLCQNKVASGDEEASGHER